MELLALTGGSGIAFSPETGELITAGGDGLARIYLLDPSELLALARSRLTRTWTVEECRQFRIEPYPAEP